MQVQTDLEQQRAVKHDRLNGRIGLGLLGKFGPPGGNSRMQQPLDPKTLSRIAEHHISQRTACHLTIGTQNIQAEPLDQRIPNLFFIKLLL